jgi:hypothetical protein
MPGPGKSFSAFQSDQLSCRTYAAGQVQGQADAANQAAVGGAVLGTVVSAGLGAAVGSAFGNAAGGAAVGAATGAGLGTAYGANGTVGAQISIQQQYDNAYVSCMASRGDPLGGAAAVAYVPAPVDPLVQSTQSELIRLGYLHDVADGVIGPKTRSAIANYQASNGLPTDASPSPSLLARLQGTPTGAAPNVAAASASASWVQPTNGAATPAVASTPAPTGWVQPTNGSATPAAATASAPAAGGWVQPTKP